MRCSICGRKLKSVKSVIRGMGCTCFVRDRKQLKLDFEKVEKDEQQTKAGSGRSEK